MSEKIPVYKKIYSDILEEIKGNSFEDDRLPSELELCSKYMVSRMTVNKALSFLEREGYIKRTRGKGSFVRRDIRKTIEESKSFSEDMKNRGWEAGSLVLKYELRKAKEVPKIQELMKLDEKDELYFFVRLRTSNDIAIAISQTYISKLVVSELPREILNASLYSYLRKRFQITPHCSNYLLQAKMPTAWESKMLGGKKDALLVVSHLSYTDTGVPFEYNSTAYLGSEYSYITNQEMANPLYGI